MFESRPPSEYYADINDERFRPDFFDQYVRAVEDHAELYKQVVDQGEDEPFVYDTTDERYFELVRTDFAVKMPTDDGYLWKMVFRGGGLYLALKAEGLLNQEQDDIIQPSASTNKHLKQVMYGPSSTMPVVVNSDGLQLYDTVNDTLFLEKDADGSPHIGAFLFEAGMSSACQHELLFEDNTLRIPTMTGHMRFGVTTELGFVPIITLLDDQHPVMERIIADRYQQRLAREADVEQG